VIDPNKDDLLYIKDKSGIKMRYTRVQRRKETGAKKYNVAGSNRIGVMVGMTILH
jgi:hypothetical protein